MSKVFQLEERSPHDTSPADSYGRRVIVFPDGTRRPSIWLPCYGDEVISRTYELGYDPGEDYVLLTGNLIELCAAVAALVREHGQIRALAFNARSAMRDYEPILLGGDYDATREQNSVRGGAGCTRRSV